LQGMSIAMEIQAIDRKKMFAVELTLIKRMGERIRPREGQV